MRSTSTTTYAWHGRSIRQCQTSVRHMVPCSPGTDASPNHQIRTPNGYFRHGQQHHDLLSSSLAWREMVPGTTGQFDRRREHAGRLS
nr:unnamed protein product [Digitaria exilis]